MKIKITYTLNGNPEYQLEDILRWPDLSTLEEAASHVTTYLDQKHGAGQYTLVGVEAVQQ